MLSLDTNVIIGLLNGRPPILRRRFAAERLARSRLTLSSIALFELRFGAANSARPEANMRALDALLSEGFDLLDFDADDAAEAGKLRAHFKRAGTPIGPYDLLIAAQARRRGATLVTANVGEFSRTPGLLVVDWSGD
ncbi:tRNA(fMet)-specific endonuclease VapC [Rhodoblastus acidophilus]|uniref:type II toxin-antitoxin system VapC family toxin n=1 Tax=Rhodoblastus acidophilus TaxID=1074 RepID=UPI002224970D|nr:type II toxin-antitoxin system VapC family toxin [Rhodoblastus acidophilus]MCW2284846.1 tRNA(fMet)-specific endonuclease VapC [Rhodoblastus acidophilus]MCW2333864.1 tRNA(fMet)-specific endonuclease VapC [Rhodoblastus acidophilus]